jgi:hypothetical protein
MQIHLPVVRLALEARLNARPRPFSNLQGENRPTKKFAL